MWTTPDRRNAANGANMSSPNSDTKPNPADTDPAGLTAWLDFATTTEPHAPKTTDDITVNTALSAFRTALEAIQHSCTAGYDDSSPRPESHGYTLAITSASTELARFKIESLPQPDDGAEPPLSIALDRFSELLIWSTGAEQQYVDAVSDLNSHALNAVSQFLQKVAAVGTVCGFEYRDRRFQYCTAEQMTLASWRMSATNFTESNAEATGTLLGYLPGVRRTEVRISDPGPDLPIRDGAVMMALVDAGLDDDFGFNSHLNQQISVTVSVRNFAGRRYSYRITGCRLSANDEPQGVPDQWP